MSKTLDALDILKENFFKEISFAGGRKSHRRTLQEIVRAIFGESQGVEQHERVGRVFIAVAKNALTHSGQPFKQEYTPVELYASNIKDMKESDSFRQALKSLIDRCYLNESQNGEGGASKGIEIDLNEARRRLYEFFLGHNNLLPYQEREPMCSLNTLTEGHFLLVEKGLFSFEQIFGLTKSDAESLSRQAEGIITLIEGKDANSDEAASGRTFFCESVKKVNPHNHGFYKLPWFMRDALFRDNFFQETFQEKAFALHAEKSFSGFSDWAECNLNPSRYSATLVNQSNFLLRLMKHSPDMRELLLHHQDGVAFGLESKQESEHLPADYKGLCAALWNIETCHSGIESVPGFSGDAWLWEEPGVILALTKAGVTWEAIKKIPENRLVHLYLLARGQRAVLTAMHANEGILKPSSSSGVFESGLRIWGSQSVEEDRILAKPYFRVLAKKVHDALESGEDLSSLLDKHNQQVMLVLRKSASDNELRDVMKKYPLPKSHAAWWGILSATSSLVAVGSAVIIAWALPTFVLAAETLSTLPPGLLIGLAVVVAGLFAVAAGACAKRADDHRCRRLFTPEMLNRSQEQESLPAASK